MIDPPSGWRYGFPKLFDKNKDETTGQWLARNGYPKHLVDEGMSRYCRFWEAPDGLETITEDINNQSAIDLLVEASAINYEKTFKDN